MMPGGPKVGYDMMEPILTKCAAQIGEEPCTTYCGEIGSGNYIKMVHNGIEYGDMQLIAEAYAVMKQIVGLDNDKMSAHFAEWNKGDLASYLIQITADILKKKDDKTDDGSYVVDKILDKTGMKGTGRWTVQEVRAYVIEMELPRLDASSTNWHPPPPPYPPFLPLFSPHQLPCNPRRRNSPSQPPR